MLLSLATSALLAPGAAFDDAVVVWHFADLGDSSGRGSSLRMSRGVTPGNSLPEPDAAASRARGGDGRAVRFDGGYLDAGHGQDGCLVLAGAEMSLCVRLRPDAGVEDTPVLSMHGGHEALLYNLFVTDLGRGPAIGFELGTDSTPGLCNSAYPWTSWAGRHGTMSSYASVERDWSSGWTGCSSTKSGP